MRRKSSDYTREVKDEPFELELESGDVVAFTRPSSNLPMGVIDAMSDWTPTNTGGTSPREIQLRYQLGDDPDAFDAFWAEWKTKSRGELDDLVVDIDKHFDDGLEPGKGRSSNG